MHILILESWTEGKKVAHHVLTTHGQICKMQGGTFSLKNSLSEWSTWKENVW